MAGIVFVPSYVATLALSTVLAAEVTDGVVVPGTLILAFTLMGTYVWRFTRRADKVLGSRIRELETDRNYHRANAAYYQTWALTGSPPTTPPPSILDYIVKETDTDGD